MFNQDLQNYRIRRIKNCGHTNCSWNPLDCLIFGSADQSQKPLLKFKIGGKKVLS